MPSGRTRQFDVDEALEVFWAPSYEVATLPELTEAVGINRPSLLRDVARVHSTWT